ncbi:type I-E CRISPR-associated protein Cas6/Cse3/CasE [Corynebacterium uterequi]|uniref:CRISPR-associated protein Cas6/Cse3/CasE, subtype I-E/ECOLI n=1 Tax=Corynebacterium uterequi TaxID=1072256 RepID=A0A0G3HEK4_9CORY|nr:type I-E CRISPR-associated protein Cas6/Cse3/CasE [Corynebacterium uterequi]AKK11719.1 CRISPR-associated protein Cas6/Cse3/CasE, subtype I-E/ECOLI [Corynebacterium uterequi]
MATFSKVLLNPARRQGRKYLTNPNALHAAVMACFPPDIDQRAERVLWRLDNRGQEHILYIVGPEKPTAAHIVETAGWDTRPQLSADYDRFLNQLMRGQVWYFELVANPTVSRSRGKGERGRVTGVIGAEGQLDWLHRKAEAMGVSFGPREASTAFVVGKSTQRFQRGPADDRPRDRVTLLTARFGGQLEVVDPQKLREALVKGVGRAKGYGCGLLTLAQSVGEG